LDNPNLGTMGSIKKLAESMGDLSARLDAYNLYLPKQARWQAELFLEDRKRDTQVNSALSDVRALSDTAAKLDRSSLPARFRTHAAYVSSVLSCGLDPATAVFYVVTRSN